MFAAVFNRDISVASSLKYPQLYRIGQRSEAFSIRKLLLKMLEAAWHSVLLYMCCNYFYSSVADRAGQEIDLWSSSFTMFSALIVVISFKIALETTTWNWLSVTFWFLSMLSWWTFLLGYTAMDITPDVYGVGFRLMTDENYWMLMAFLPTVCLMPDIAYRYIKRMYFCTPMDLVSSSNHHFEF